MRRTKGVHVTVAYWIVAGITALDLTGLTAGARIEVALDLRPRVYTADERIDAVRAAVAVERGPLVYAVEAADQPDLPLDRVRMHADTPITEAPSRDLPGVVELRIPALREEPTEGAWPYRRAAASGRPASRPVMLTAIPYYAWGNRARGAMRVWIPRD